MISITEELDLELIYGVVQAAVPTLYELKEYQAKPVEDVQQRLLRITEEACAVCLVRDGADVLGIMALSEDMDFHIGECVSLVYMFTFPEFRNRGIGKLMLQYARATAAAANAALAYTRRVADYEYKLIYEVPQHG